MIRNAKQRAHGIKALLFSIVMVAVAAITIFELLLFSQINRNLAARSQRYLDSSLSRIRTEVDNTLAYIRMVGYQLIDNEDIRDLLTGDMSPGILDSARNAENIINLLSQANSDIQDIVLVDCDGDMNSFLTQFDIFIYRRLAALYDFSSGDEAPPFYSIWRNSPESESFSFVLILPVIRESGHYDTERVGSVIIYCVFLSLEELFNATAVGSGESYYLMNTDDVVLGTSRGAAVPVGTLTKTRTADSAAAAAVDLGFPGWRIEGRIESRFLSEDYELANRLIVFNAVLFALLVFGIYLAVDRSINRPISMIARQISTLPSLRGCA